MRRRAGVGLPGALGVIACLLAPACGDDYPLPPTPCDEWCDATERVACGSDPAQCVATCEQWGGRPQDEACAQHWDDALNCLKALEDRTICEIQNYGAPNPCALQVGAYQSCVCGEGCFSR